MSLPGPLLDRATAALALAVVGLVALGVLRSRPREGTVGFLLVLCLVPIWLGLELRAYLPPASVVGLLVLLAGFRLSAVRPSTADVPVFFLGVLATTATVLGLLGITPLATAVVVWGVAYAVGRHVCDRVGLPWLSGAIAVVFTATAALALLEALTGVNPFIHLRSGNALYGNWSEIQVRGGRPRVEGAFGHSIALGSSLAAAIPFVLGAPFRLGLRVTMVLILLAAIVATFSRAAMACAVVGLVLSVVYLDVVPRAARLRIAGATGLLAVAASPLVLTTFSSAGDEAAGSAAYRGSIFVDLGPEIVSLGISPSVERTAEGVLRFGDYRSIDSFLLLSGLTYGAVFAGTLAVALLVAGVAVVRRRATAATVALVAQTPALLSVALITQYASVAWFVAGVAVSAHVARAQQRAGSAPAEPSPDRGLPPSDAVAQMRC